MYGTVAVCRVAPDDVARLRALAEAEDALGIEGYLGTDVLVSDNHQDVVVLAVRFVDRGSYVANAESPEQHQRYLAMRALMADDPVWYDGDWVMTR